MKTRWWRSRLFKSSSGFAKVQGEEDGGGHEKGWWNHLVARPSFPCSLQEGIDTLEETSDPKSTLELRMINNIDNMLTSESSF